jgi:hypothetical protein
MRSRTRSPKQPRVAGRLLSSVSQKKANLLLDCLFAAVKKISSCLLETFVARCFR